MIKNVLPASGLVGELVHSSDGKLTGQIEEVLVDTESARVMFALISFDASTGLGDDWIAYPWIGVRMDLSQGGDGLILDASADVLKSAPSFTKTDWPNFADPQYETGIFQHFGFKSKKSTREQSRELQ